MREPSPFSPLLWQCWPIFALAGLLSLFYPLPGATLAALCFLADKRLRSWKRASLACLIFGCALLYAFIFTPRPPEETPP